MAFFFPTARLCGGWVAFSFKLLAKGVAVPIATVGTCDLSVKCLCFSSLSLPTRCDSWSNSERSLEQASFDDVFVDCPQPPPSGSLAGSSHPGNGSQEAPSMRPQAALIWMKDVNGPSRDHFSLPLGETSLNSAIQVDQNQASLPYGVKELDVMSNTPPPRPPKPSHLSEWRHKEQFLCRGPSNLKKPEGTMVPRRISLSGLDNMRTWKGKCWMMLNFRY